MTRTIPFKENGKLLGPFKVETFDSKSKLVRTFDVPNHHPSRPFITTKVKQ